MFIYTYIYISNITLFIETDSDRFGFKEIRL